jgi:DNA-binding MarR family transcriptional regulator
MSSRHTTPQHRPVLDSLRALSAASDLLDAAVAQHLHMHRTDLRCLDYLARFGPTPAGRLGEAVGLTSGALTIAVDRLERTGFVQRRADEHDRRRVVIHLAKGANRVIALFRDLSQSTQHLLERYSDADLQLLSAFLADASEALARQASTISQRSASRRQRQSRVAQAAANQPPMTATRPMLSPNSAAETRHFGRKQTRR